MHTDTEGNEYYMLTKSGYNLPKLLRCMYVVSARHNKEQVTINDESASNYNGLIWKTHTHQARINWREKVDAGWQRERNPTPKDIEEMGKNI